MTYIPYSRQDVSEADIEAVVTALRSDFLTQGPQIPAFEAEFAERHSASFAVSVSNATCGLHIACLALGVGQGSLVWTSPNSFVASANCALYCGADIDFVDIDPLSRNMSTDALAEKLAQAEQAGRLPTVVIPVDFSGLPCDLREIRELADRYGFKILADSSHATGASYLGAPVGSRFADITVFSFHAVKVVTTAEGGMLLTDDPEIARRLRLLRSHGITRDPAEMDGPPDGPWDYQQITLGYNYRITDLQAALGRSQLNRMVDMQARRVEIADRYDRLFDGAPLLLPLRLNDRVSSWHLYVIEIDESRTAATRASLFQALRDAQIGANVHYIPIHTQPYYLQQGFKRGDFPNAERFYDRAISLPLFPKMTEEQQHRVVDVTMKSL